MAVLKTNCNSNYLSIIPIKTMVVLFFFVLGDRVQESRVQGKLYGRVSECDRQNMGKDEYPGDYYDTF